VKSESEVSSRLSSGACVKSSVLPLNCGFKLCLSVSLLMEFKIMRVGWVMSVAAGYIRECRW
jgi:hypothetical protein